MKIRGNPETIGKAVAVLMRVVGRTLRFKIEDRARLLDPEFKEPLIWTFWHNRMFAVPLLRALRVPHRTGAALTSGSRDGSIVAAVMKAFGQKAVRGSSSRRGAGAVRELAETLENGEDVAISPDGPRGPRYTVGPGVVFLAQQTGAAILPIHIEYSRAVRLKSWDRFIIPLPFSEVRVICDRLIYAKPGDDAQAMTRNLERMLQPLSRRDPVSKSKDIDENEQNESQG
jgi:lysophospholipid acyltransferase (LPLAT)-like uncharacterized protein